MRETDHSANEAAAGPSRGVLPTFKRRCSLRRKTEESQRPQRVRQLDPGVRELRGQTHRRGSRPIRSCGQRDTRQSSRALSFAAFIADRHTSIPIVFPYEIKKDPRDLLIGTGDRLRRGMHWVQSALASVVWVCVVIAPSRVCNRKRYCLIFKIV